MTQVTPILILSILLITLPPPMITAHQTPTILTNTTLYVGGTGPNNYTTIQAAIDNATTNTTIYIYNNTYHEHFTITKTLHLIGIPTTTGQLPTINGGNDHTTITITSDHTSLTYLKITNGDAGFGQTALTITSNYTSIHHCWSYHTGTALQLTNAHHTHIKNLTSYRGWQGIVLTNASYNTLNHLNIYKHTYEHLLLEPGSHHNTITHSRFHNANTGIALHNVDRIILNNNTITENDAGIYINQAQNLTITNTTFINNSISFSQQTTEKYPTYTITNNTVNQQPILYTTNRNNFTFTQPLGQLILINCHHGTISNLNITRSNTPIYLRYCTHLHIHNNTLNKIRNYNDYAIHIQNCTNITLQNTLFDSCIHCIYLHHTTHSTIKNNLLDTVRSTAIILTNSTHILIHNNTIINPYIAIDIHTTTHTIISNNTITNAEYHGIRIFSETNQIINNTITHGLQALEITKPTTITHNTISYNTRGLRLSRTNNCHITHNTFQHNTAYAILIKDYSDKSHITQNTFELNNIGISIHVSDPRKTTYIYQNNFIHNTQHTEINEQFTLFSRLRKSTRWYNNYWHENKSPFFYIFKINKVIPPIPNPYGYGEPLYIQRYQLDWFPAKNPITTMH